MNTNPCIRHTETHVFIVLTCRTVGVEAVNAGSPQLPPLARLDGLTDLHRQGKERELARDGERMGEGDVAGE